MTSKLIDLEITDFSSRGFGLAHLPNRSSVEVAHAIPGDCVRVELKRKKKSVQKGRLQEILKFSKDRVEPRCQHAFLCGGCCWQSMDYPSQLRHKQDSVCRSFSPLLDSTVQLDPLIPAELPWRYRNKMEFSFSENRAGTRFLGLMIAHAEPYVFNVAECHLAPEWMSACLEKVRTWWEQTSLLAYRGEEDVGTLRYLTLRHAFRTGQKMAILNISANPNFAPSQEDLSHFIKALEGVDSIVLRAHYTKKGVPNRFEEIQLDGLDHIVEELHLQARTFSFKVSPSSFFQPNPSQAEKLYDRVIECLREQKVKVLYDLYCGTGTLAMAAAPFVEKAIGIEQSSQAVLDAKWNAELNALENVFFYEGDVPSVLRQLRLSADFQSPDAVIVDPPRAGLSSEAIKCLKELFPARIIYVSCNPATQAENAKALIAAGYRLEWMQAIDQFPHTAHIENIALFSRNTSL